jgi:putative transposase
MSFFIDKEEYLLQCGKYIELNPVRAGIAALPEEYKFSSYRFYAFGDSDFLLTPDPVYQRLANSESAKRRSYQEFVVDDNLWKNLSVRRVIPHAGDSSKGGDSSGDGACPR